MIELLVVISIIAVLAGLVTATAGGARSASFQKKALGQIKAMEEGLEMYRLENGVYPRPVGGASDPVIQAKMLYQALTGDGTNFIDGVEPTASDGNPKTDGKRIIEAAFAGRKKSGFVHEDYYLLDPWHQPYHYQRGDESNQTINNSTFDLWSEGSSKTEKNEDLWIKNW
ncbi:MAG: type II secretory pathway pseudopilin PulG [Verrucomicrobiales bacterium]|jgi:type II secretory pathway pseudopilin PulG